MRRLIFLLIQIIAIVCCYDNKTIKDLEEDIAKDLKMILKNPFDLKGECQTLKPVNVTFLLYNKENPDKGIPIDPKKPETINSKKKIVVLVHGWLGSSTSLNIQKLKSAYLKRYDCNVLIVDWSDTAWQSYVTSACELPSAAQSTSNFICLLSNRLTIPLADIHLIGHGLGAHLAGVVGYKLNNKCKTKIGRITGLDPTHPMFFRIPEKDRLDETDALFVDIIHTDTGFFGYFEPCGAVDFSPNCARNQPGCPKITLEDTELVTDAMCYHLRSIDYMTDSVNSKDLIAVSCGLCPRRCKADIINEVYQVMGEDCRKVPKPARNFYIPTASSPPFGLGMGPYKVPFKQNFTLENLFLASLPGNGYLPID